MTTGPAPGQHVGQRHRLERADHPLHRIAQAGSDYLEDLADVATLRGPQSSTSRIGPTMALAACSGPLAAVPTVVVVMGVMTAVFVVDVVHGVLQSCDR